MDKNRFKSMTAFLDMLWILLAGFGAMFIIAYLLIQPIAKEADVIKRAEYIIVLEWEHKSDDDIDLWVMDPNGKIVCFKNKSVGFMNLEKDDLGRINDVITDEYGNETVIEMNREVITLRGVVAGEYQVMVHVFSRKFDPVSEAFIDHPVKYNVEVIKINPYDVVYRQEGLYTTRGTEISVVRFTVDANADYISYNNLESDFINGVETGRGGYVQQTADGMGEER
jgi:hypothetical protein